MLLASLYRIAGILSVDNRLDDGCALYEGVPAGARTSKSISFMRGFPALSIALIVKIFLPSLVNVKL